MKKPKLIYTYWQRTDTHSAIKTYELRVYESGYSYNPRYFFSLGNLLFNIEAQSNIDSEARHPLHNNIRGLFDAYGMRLGDLSAGNEKAFDLARKLCRDTVSMKEVVRRLKKLGAVRYAIGKVEDPKSYDNKEWMPRKFVGKKSAAYWSAICSGIEVAL